MKRLWFDEAAVEIVDMVNRTPFTENAVANIIMKHWDECPDDEKQVIMDLMATNEMLRHEVASMGQLISDKK